MTYLRLQLPLARTIPTAHIKQFAGWLLLVVSLVVGVGCATTDQKSATTPIQKPSTVARTPDLKQDKLLLERLLAELQRSARSFVYLRSKGFTQSDQEFEQLIAQNNAVLRPTRIVRYDEKGARQIPGWPGVMLTPAFKTPASVVPPKAK